MTCWRPPSASLTHADGLRLRRYQERLGRMASSSARVRGVCSAGASVSAFSVSSVAASPWGMSIPRARDRSATAARAEAARSLGVSLDSAPASAGEGRSAVASRDSAALAASGAEEADAAAVARSRSPRSSPTRRLLRSSEASSGESAVRRRRVEVAARRERFAAGFCSDAADFLVVFVPGSSVCSSAAGAVASVPAAPSSA